jgi:hypothetical protein
MMNLVLTTHEMLLIARQERVWSIESHLEGKEPESIAIDPGDPSRIYVGTHGHGLWRSADAGSTWVPVSAGIPHSVITAVAVGRAGGAEPGVLYAGTEPSTLARSEDGGETWHELPMLGELPSSVSWSFPPQPDTHHVRWIETDRHLPDKLYVAIEAGALVRSFDRGKTWHDRVPGGPIDTHTAATHRAAEAWIYSAAGDGYFESRDGGDSWLRPMDGLQHRYLVGMAVDPGDPMTVVVSAATGPYLAYNPRSAEAFLYRKPGGGRFELVMEGLPEPLGTVASRLATHPSEPGVFYAANNHGLFRSGDGGKSWRASDIDWPEGMFRRGVAALEAFSL